MADTVSKEKRSEIMSKIGPEDSGIELAVRRFLHSRNIRFRKHVKDLPGSPDIAIKKYRVAVFINGCFWHGHEDCDLYKLPKTRPGFWKEKARRNRARDKRKVDELESMGWTVFILWECEIRDSLEATAGRVYEHIESSRVKMTDKRPDANKNPAP